MDNKSLLAIVLCVVILVGYQALISFLYPPQDGAKIIENNRRDVVPEDTRPNANQGTRPPQRETGTPPSSGIARTLPPIGEPRSREISVETETYIAKFTSTGGRLRSFRLKNYPVTLDPDSPLLEMVQEGTYGELPFVLNLRTREQTMTDTTVSYAANHETDAILVSNGDQKELLFKGKHVNGATIVKKYTFFGSGYGLKLAVSVKNLPFRASTVSLSWLEGARPEAMSSYYEVYGPAALIDRSFEYENASDWEPGDSYGPGNIRWAGFTNSYFIAAMMPDQEEGDDNRNKNQLFFSESDGTLDTNLSVPWDNDSSSYTLYLGPKETTALNAIDPSLDRAIDFGWSHFIARPLVSLLRVLFEATGNYGTSIILLTVLVKLVFFPLSNKSFKSMSAMKKLQPQMEQLREQHKDDKQKLNQEMMELYKRYQVNPLGGCLPMLVQLPVFIGLYQGLLYAIELRQAPFFGWIIDLSQPDRLGSIPIPFVEPSGVPILTLLMGGSMVIQQMMTPSTGDPMQQKMMLLMPVIFTVMFINFPAGLVLYWLINNVLSVAQQHWYNKAHG